MLLHCLLINGKTGSEANNWEALMRVGTRKDEEIFGWNVRSSITADCMMTMASVSALEFEYIEYNVHTHIQQPAPPASSYIESTPVGQGLACFSSRINVISVYCVRVGIVPRLAAKKVFPIFTNKLKHPIFFFPTFFVAQGEVLALVLKLCNS